MAIFCFPFFTVAQFSATSKGEAAFSYEEARQRPNRFPNQVQGIISSSRLQLLVQETMKSEDCDELPKKYKNLKEYKAAILTPIEAGCCRPPPEYMHYFFLFGFIQKSWGLVLDFLVVSIASAVVESLPISTELDDNLTVTLTSVLLGSLIL